MRNIILILLLTMVHAICPFRANCYAQESIYEFTINSLQGEPVDFSEYQGKVVLIVNTASRCGNTPQYAGLQILYETYEERGFVVLGFPCNQFGGQEPGTHDEIEEFCRETYHVTFPMFEKIEVNGSNAHPLYVYLKASVPRPGNNNIIWNFEKFLINQNGIPVKRYEHDKIPSDLVTDIETMLSETGISEIGISKIQIYPNPVKDNLFLKTKATIDKIEIYNILGKEFLSQTSNIKTEINISHLPKGLYFINIISNGKIIRNSKFMKQ